MDIVFDPDKDARNIREHGYSLADFQGFDTEPTIKVDDRLDYGEMRYQAYGRINGKGHMIVFMKRGDDMRLISFRRAHEKEMRRHGQ